jgi:hypothetical protein
VFAVVAIAFISLAGQPAAATEAARPAAGAYADKDRAAALEALKSSREKFLKSFEGLTEAQWKFKPAADSWSVAETAEHITLAERVIGGMLKDKILKAPFDAAKKAQTAGKDELVMKVIPSREKKVKGPEVIAPRGTFATRDELVKAFDQARAANVELVQSAKEDLRAHVADHPAVGPVDGHQWVLLIAAHTLRHTAQIEEVKTSAGFPK